MYSVNPIDSASLKATLAALVVMCATPTLAVETTFTIDEQQSSLTIDASTTVFGSVPLNDSDTQSLGGTIDASFDFGTTGAFPTTADLHVTGSAISPLQPFSLTLGLPQVLGVSIDVTGAVADVTTPNPPVVLTRLSGAQIVYEFDASGFDVTLNQGTVVTSGAVNETIDLAEMPVMGTAPSGTIGNLTLTATGTSGPLTMVDATFELPIVFTQVIDVNGQQVTLDTEGNVLATSSFTVALAGLPGDFDGDVDVDGADLNGAPDGWQARYGADLDGNDFLVWQQYFGTVAPGQAAVSSVPEPGALLLTALAASGLAVTRRRQGVDRESARMDTDDNE